MFVLHYVRILDCRNISSAVSPFLCLLQIVFDLSLYLIAILAEMSLEMTFTAYGYAFAYLITLTTAAWLMVKLLSDINPPATYNALVIIPGMDCVVQLFQRFPLKLHPLFFYQYTLRPLSAIQKHRPSPGGAFSFSIQFFTLPLYISRFDMSLTGF